MRFRGTHFERGVQRGRRLKGTLTVPDVSALPGWFVDGCRAAAEELHPPAVEEFEGLVQGGGFDRGAMAAYYFARLESRLGGCTMFAVEPSFRDGGDGPIVGRNYDWAVADLRWCELHRYLPAEGLRRIGYTHHWAGCADVLNEGGLYVAIASLPAQPVHAPGVQWNTLVDAVSERCTRVAEAVDVLASASHLRPMSYLLADAAGGVAVVEATPARVSVRRPEKGSVVAANVAQGGNVLCCRERPAAGRAPIGTPPDRGGESGQRATCRIQRTVALLGRQALQLAEEGVRSILTDHEAPVCTGDHDDPDGAPWATIWSGICLPAEAAFRIAPGLPCRHQHQTFTFDA